MAKRALPGPAPGRVLELGLIQIGREALYS